MNLINSEAKRLINTTVQLLNQPLIKEGVKNIAGSAAVPASHFFRVS